MPLDSWYGNVAMHLYICTYLHIFTSICISIHVSLSLYIYMYTYLNVYPDTEIMEFPKQAPNSKAPHPQKALRRAYIL